MIYSCVQGNNEKMFKNVVDLYFKEGNKVVDLTWGKGNFWNKVDITKFDLIKSDLKINGIDFRNTPYENNVFDVVVLDPPYTVRQGNRYEMNDRYGLNKISSVKEIYDLYYKGILEARRILKKSGLLLIKNQDITHGNQEYWLHVDIMKFCELNYLWPIDLFILQNNQKVKEYKQKTSRRNHSYLWVMKKKKW